MKNKWLLLAKRLKEFFLLWRHYGFAYAFWGLVWWICFYLRPPFAYKISTHAIRRKTRFLDKYVERRYADVISRYERWEQAPEAVEEYNIWVFWGQGEENMPPLVAACYRRLRATNEHVKLLTLDNVGEYVDLPPMVLEKVKEGRLEWAHYSDILRAALLAKHGGLWLDATVWVSGTLPVGEWKQYAFFTARGEVARTSRAMRFWTTFDWNWSSWCLGSSGSHHVLLSFVAEMMMAWACRENVWADYVLQDYLIYYACRKFPQARADMEHVPPVCKRRNDLASMLGMPYREQAYQALVETDFVFKLSFRTAAPERTADGQETFLGKILHQNR